MSVKDNFYQAVKELFNKDEENQSPLAKSLQNNADDNSDTDNTDAKGLAMASSDNDTAEVTSTPLKKPEASNDDEKDTPASTTATKPILGGVATAAASYSSMQSAVKPTTEATEAPKPPVSTPASSLFGSKPATPAAPATTTPSAFGAKPVAPATPVASATSSTATTTPSAFGAKPVAPVSTPTSSIFGLKTPTPAVKEEKPAEAVTSKPIFSAAAISNAAAEIPKPKISTDDLSASLNAIINEEYRPLSGSLDSTVIAHGTVIKGDIQTTSDIEINGAVIGNIESQRSVSVNGQVEGNITAESIRLSQTSITGNLSATGLVILDKDSTLIGDIKGENVIIGGKVKGNIDGKGKATLKGQSVVAGNITIAEITIEDGAKLQGFIQTISMTE